LWEFSLREEGRLFLGIFYDPEMAGLVAFLSLRTPEGVPKKGARRGIAKLLTLRGQPSRERFANGVASSCRGIKVLNVYVDARRKRFQTGLKGPQTAWFKRDVSQQREEKRQSSGGSFI